MDVHGRVELANDEPQPGCADRLARAGRCEPADGLLAIPAGALADIIDRRRFLIIGEAANTAIAAVFAVLVSLDLVTAAVLLLFTFLISAFGAFTAPAWQAVTPQLVPKEDLLPRSRRTASASTSAGRSDRRLEAHSRPRLASRRRSGSMRRAISASMAD